MKVVAIVILSALLTIFGLIRLAFGVDNPTGLLPMQRVAFWIQENPTNVGGYVLRWGTNRLDLHGVNTTSAVIELPPGQTTLLLHATAATGTNTSTVVSNTVRMIKMALESTTNGMTWAEETNWTWTVFPSGSKLFRARMEGSR